MNEFISPEYATKVVKDKLVATGEYTQPDPLRAQRLTESLAVDLTPFDPDEDAFPLARRVGKLISIIFHI